MSTQENQAADLMEELFITSAEYLGQDILAFIIQELKAMPKVWQQLSEHEQQSIIDRATEHTESAVRAATGIIFSEGCISVIGDIEGVAIKDEIKATIRIMRNNEQESLTALFTHHNQPCRVLLTGANVFTGGIEGSLKPDPDQADLLEIDPLFDEAVLIVKASKKASISFIQRELRIGYNRAARIIDQLENSGIVSAADHSGARTVITAN